MAEIARGLLTAACWSMSAIRQVPAGSG